MANHTILLSNISWRIVDPVDPKHVKLRKSSMDDVVVLVDPMTGKNFDRLRISFQTDRYSDSEPIDIDFPGEKITVRRLLEFINMFYMSKITTLGDVPKMDPVDLCLSTEGGIRTVEEIGLCYGAEVGGAIFFEGIVYERSVISDDGTSTGVYWIALGS